MPPVLLAWELGGGMGHVTLLHTLAEKFFQRGMQVVAAVKDLSAAHSLAACGVKVMQAPLWPVSLRASSLAIERSSSASMGDILASAGLADGRVVGTMLDAWGGLIDLVKPGLVLGEFAPGAALAARGRVALALAGSGYTLPPAHLVEFPRLHQIGDLLWPEAETVKTINVELMARSQPLLVHLPNLFEAQASYVNSLPALDPYHAQRLVPVSGRYQAKLPWLRGSTADRVFAYLSPGCNVPEHVVTALGRLSGRLDIYGPSLRGDQKQTLLQAGATLFEFPQDLNSYLHRCQLVIHFGVAGTATTALLAGVPQLALSLDIEKDLNGQALERLGAGRLLMIHRSGVVLDAALLDEMVADKGLADRAMAVAQRLRAELRPNALDSFVDACVELAKRS